MRAIARKIRRALWTLNGYFGKAISIDTPQKCTVLITYYNPARMNNIESQVRNVHKCAFVDKIIISNHNPAVNIEEKINLHSERLVFINQKTRQGCGYRWYVAELFNPEYLIVIDDDILLFSWQLEVIFKYLLAEPAFPHGIAGMIHMDNDVFEYFEKKNMDVDFLCEVYAVTRDHLKCFFKLKDLIATNDAFASMIDNAADFMLISQTGNRSPKIHDVGRVSRSFSFNESGVAVHKAPNFGESLYEINRALTDIGVKNRG